MSFLKTLQALKKYKPKSLGRHSLLNHCALGACAEVVGLNVFEVGRERGYASLTRKLGLTCSQQDAVVRANDGFNGSKKERYEYMLAYLQRLVEEERAAQKARKASGAASR